MWHQAVKLFYFGQCNNVNFKFPMLPVNVLKMRKLFDNIFTYKLQ